MYRSSTRGEKLVEGKSYQEVEGSFWIVVSGNWEPSRGEGFWIGASGNREASRSEWKSTSGSKKKLTSGRKLEV